MYNDDECFQYQIGEPTTVSEPFVITNTEPCCGSCKCGYVLFESLLKYLPEVKSVYREDGVLSSGIEFKLRQQIIRISRLFDLLSGYEPGYFSKAHYNKLQVIPSNNSRYLKINHYLAGSLTLLDSAGQVVPPQSYKYINGFLVLNPEYKSGSGCGCSSICHHKKRERFPEWHDNFYTAVARFGFDCVDSVVELAVTAYIINIYKSQDLMSLQNNAFPTTSVKPPYEWDSAINAYKAKRMLFNSFGIA